ncbi:MAG: AmmeMemoRadiSam system protein B [Candidatus Hydrogenedentes bacterium]|nr:AmmeMemoRadiSam system protein B [Candidatus Hydrogenedentota bacterium]
MRKPALCLAVILACFCAAAPRADAQRRIVPRLPAVAESHYPADPDTLLKTLRSFYDAADAPEVTSFLAACIASPAPYGLAGKVSAHAFKSLKPGQYERVIILTSAHTADIEGCSLPEVDAFLTPLGPVALDQEAVRRLVFSPLFSVQALNYSEKGSKRGRVHEWEHGIETLLPYLQERLLEFKLVPVVIGSLTTPSGKFNPAAADSVAKTIRPLLDDRTLLVVSSSFTHFGNDFSNRPFNENIQKNIERLDRQAFECLLSLDAAAFQRYMEDTENVIDGENCIHVLLRLLPPGTQARILAYEVSCALTGDMNRSVSFSAFTFHDPARPAAAPQPDKVRPLPMPGIPAGTPPAPPTPEAAPGEKAKTAKQPKKETP